MTDQEELTAIATMELFSGSPGFLGGLSNERELARYMPDRFRVGWNTDPWCKVAANVFYLGANITGWKFKTTDKKERQRQVSCLSGALGGFDLKHEEKMGLCGWMLSEMLTEVPS